MIQFPSDAQVHSRTEASAVDYPSAGRMYVSRLGRNTLIDLSKVGTRQGQADSALQLLANLGDDVLYPGFLDLLFCMLDRVTNL
jgi:hypothetical protein